MSVFRYPDITLAAFAFCGGLIVGNALHGVRVGLVAGLLWAAFTLALATLFVEDVSMPPLGPFQ